MLPAACAELDEGSLREALLVNLTPIHKKTGVSPVLRGGKGTPDKLHFYVA